MKRFHGVYDLTRHFPVRGHRGVSVGYVPAFKAIVLSIENVLSPLRSLAVNNLPDVQTNPFGK
jgi:hypothetical protein